MSKILITGGHGQLGSELKELAPFFGSLSFTYTDHQHLDITNTEEVTKYIREGQFSALINCAAYTAVDKAESEKDKALAVNGTATGVLARACKEMNVKFVHISTDFVFDGTMARPLLETDITNPLGVYGATKLEGERRALENNADSLIIRTSWVYSSYGNNFVKTILRLCKERESLNIIFDQIGTPTYAHDLARVILEIVSRNNFKPGLYHYSNEGVASWYDFAIAIRDLAGLKTPINPIETSQYPTPAVRPKYSVLNKKKFKDTFNISIPYWRDSLVSCIKKLEQGS
jgi:dTDP-4-dehydrorhamnose reductase